MDCSQGSSSSPVRRSKRVDYYDKLEGPQGSVPEAVLSRLAARSSLTPDSSKLILVMVGLPARGKSFISHKLVDFLRWSGNKTEIFNAGQNRRSHAADTVDQGTGRETAPAAADAPSTRGADKSAAAAATAVASGAAATAATTYESPKKMQRVLSGVPEEHARATFFDPNNDSARERREKVAMATLDELLDWLWSGGEIGIFDATNSTRARRRAVVERVAAAGARCGETAVVFIESICEDRAVLEANMRTKVRASPDFAGLLEEDALADLRQRMANYESVYESVGDDEGAYIKLFNLSSKVTANSIFGRMSQRVLPYVMSLHVGKRPVLLLAISSSQPSASASKITRWIRNQLKASSVRILSSTEPAPLEAAGMVAGEGEETLAAHHSQQSGLNQLDVGSESATAESRLGSMRFTERFAGGESFSDLVRRLEPCLLNIEASMDPVLVLAHATPCRALRAYFLGLPVEGCMGAASSPAAKALANEVHSVVELTPKGIGGGWTEQIHTLE